MASRFPVSNEPTGGALCLADKGNGGVKVTVGNGNGGYVVTVSNGGLISTVTDR